MEPTKSSPSVDLAPATCADYEKVSAAFRAYPGRDKTGKELKADAFAGLIPGVDFALLVCYVAG